MTNFKNKGFSLVELLVVITILAIISIYAYTNFSGSTDKAKNAKKASDITSIESGLQAFYQEKNYYPMPAAVSPKNVWGYANVPAQINNTLSGTKNGAEYATIITTSSLGGGNVYETGSSTNQIGAKGVMDKTVLTKQYLSIELLDPSLKDIKVGGGTFGDYGIGKYVYGVYAKGNTDWTVNSQKGSQYNLAYTLKDDQKGYKTVIVGSFDKTACTNCPASLVGSGTFNANLDNGETTSTGSAIDPNERLAYPLTGF